MKKLIERGMVRRGTEFEAYYAAVGLSGYRDSRLLGRFTVGAVLAPTNSALVIEGVLIDDGSRHRLAIGDLASLDGMELRRYLRTYQLNDDGSDVPQGKRRGRRRKCDIEAMARQQAGAHQENQD